MQTLFTIMVTIAMTIVPAIASAGGFGLFNRARSSSCNVNRVVRNNVVFVEEQVFVRPSRTIEFIEVQGVRRHQQNLNFFRVESLNQHRSNNLQLRVQNLNRRNVSRTVVVERNRSRFVDNHGRSNVQVRVQRFSAY